MSIQFSSTTTKNGLIQLIERNIGFDDGRITDDPLLLAQFTGDINIAMDNALNIIFSAAGTWQYDDNNHTDYPIITTDLVANQRDYAFTTDQSGNLILDVYKVMIKNPTSGYYEEIYPVDQQTDAYMQGFWSGENVTGIPSRYDKTANGIFLDCIPSYNSTDGIKIFINRESTYFATTDTVKKAGFAGLYHEYLALNPSYKYAYRNNLGNKRDLQNEMLVMENAMRRYYRDRSRDEVPVLSSEYINSI